MVHHPVVHHPCSMVHSCVGWYRYSPAWQGEGMTIAAAYLTSEGVVLGADSATVVNARVSGGPAHVAQILRHSQKVFEIGERSRFGLTTWGAGSIRGVSHRAIVARLADTLEQGTTVQEVADKLVELVSDEIGSATGSVGAVGYYLGGWNPDRHEPECFQIGFPEQGEPDVEAMPLGEARFSGAPQFFTRVFRGFDQYLPGRLLEELKQKLETVPDDFDDLFRKAFDDASGPLVSAGYRDLPIREAIDYIHSYLHLTVKAYKFQFGVPLCGGPVEVAFVSTDRRFRWVCHKGFDSAIREEEGYP